MEHGERLEMRGKKSGMGTMSGVLVSGPQHFGSRGLEPGDRRESKKNQWLLNQEPPPSDHTLTTWLHSVTWASGTEPNPTFLLGVEQQIAPVPQLDDLFHIPLFQHQPPATGVRQLLHVGEGASNLWELQWPIALVVFLRCPADALQDCPLYTGILHLCPQWQQSGLPQIAMQTFPYRRPSSWAPCMAGSTAGDVLGCISLWSTCQVLVCSCIRVTKCSCCLLHMWRRVTDLMISLSKEASLAASESSLWSPVSAPL